MFGAYDETAPMTEFKYKIRSPRNTVIRSNQIFFKDLTPETEKERLAQKGIKILHSFDGLAIEEGVLEPANAPLMENEKMHTLTVNLKYNKEEIFDIDGGYAFPNDVQGKAYFMERSYDSLPDKIAYKVPEGTYDIAVFMTTSSLNLLLLTNENISVMDDCEITLDEADATVDIIWNPLLPDSKAPCGDTFVLDPNTFELTEIQQGNVILTSNFMTIDSKKHNVSFGFLLLPYRMIIGSSEIVNGFGHVRTMPNNDYVFRLATAAVAESGGYGIGLMADATHSDSPTNDVENYITIKPEFAQTPYQPQPRVVGSDSQKESQFDREKNFAMVLASVKEDIMASSLGLIVSQEKEISIQPSIHICQDRSMDDKFQIMPVPVLFEDWDSDYFMRALPINDELEVLALNNTQNAILGLSENRYLALPNSINAHMSKVTNPWLSFELSKSHVWNYGCPVLVFSSVDSGWGPSFEIGYIGRLGEKRGVDLLETTSKVKIDNDSPSDAMLEIIESGQLPKEGKIDFEFIDNNIAIDDIAGKNIAHVSFNMSCHDWQPPTLQLVRFIDINDNFIDRYATGEEGVIEFYGGDFKYNQNSKTGEAWYTEEPSAIVKVEYAPYGTDSFLPLEVENIPERDFMPGFGTYYRGSLAAVDRMSENGWFDVRITLTDTEGNYQEQTLSPAFKIEERIGVETMMAPEIGVAIVNDNITVCGCENPIVQIYSTDGILINLNFSSKST